jgi:RNA polymerase sigma-70 factor (ECF subfamily)
MATISHNGNKPSWAELASAAQGGDTAAYNRLLREIVPYLRGMLLPGLADKSAVEDIIQEILISVHKSLKTYTPDRPFKPWLMAIANFRRTDYLRRFYAGQKYNMVPLEAADFAENVVTEPPSESEYGYDDVENALKHIPRKQRDVFTKLKVEGYTAQEVANQTGMNVSAVKVSAHRTLKKLKEILGQ